MAMTDDLLEALRSAPLFAAVPAPAVRQLVERCTVRPVRAGEVVLLAGEEADRFYVILSGRVKVYQLSPRGEEQILHLYGSGATFGEAAMWAGGRFPANAAAIEPARLLVIPRPLLRQTVERNPDLAFGMLAGLSAKLREFATLVERVTLKEVPVRLAAVLLDLAAAAQSDRVRLPVAKRALAAQLGTVPETLSRALRKLIDADLITVHGREITIRDRAGLEQMVAG